MKNREYIRELANFLASTNTTMNSIELANHLNWNNFKTKEGKKYKGKRGIYTLIRTTWKWLDRNKKYNEAQNVAKAFMTPRRKYAYK